MSLSKDPVIARIQRLKRAETMLREEYANIEAQIPTYKEAYQKWNIDTKTDREYNDRLTPLEWKNHRHIPPEPQAPTKSQAETKATQRILDEMTISKRLLLEYMDIIKDRIQRHT